MAQTLGTYITNLDAKPFEKVSSRLHGGFVRGIVLTDEVPDTANGDTMILAKLPVDAILPSVKAAFDDLGTAGTVDIGLFYKASDGTYTVIDADCIANNIDVNAAAVALTEYRFQVKGIETIAQPLWQLAGLSARPAYADVYVGLTTDTGTTTAGTVSMVIQFQE